MKIEELYNLSVWANFEVAHLMRELDNIRLDEHRDEEYVSCIHEYIDYILRKHPRSKNVAAHDMLCTVLVTGYFYGDYPFFKFKEGFYDDICDAYPVIHKRLNKGRKLWTFLYDESIFFWTISIGESNNDDRYNVYRNRDIDDRRSMIWCPQPEWDSAPRVRGGKRSFVKQFYIS